MRIGCGATASVGDAIFEIETVERVGGDVDPVADAVTLDHRTDRLPQFGHVSLNCVAGGLGRVVAPQPVDETIERHDPIRFGEEPGEHQALLRSAEQRLRGSAARAGSDRRHHPQ